MLLVPHLSVRRDWLEVFQYTLSWETLKKMRFLNSLNHHTSLWIRVGSPTLQLVCMCHVTMCDHP